MPRLALTGHELNAGPEGRAAPRRLFRVPVTILATGLLAPWLLTGCASGASTPLADMFSDAFSSTGGQAERAAEISFASLSIDTGERSGLVVLGAISEADTFWPTGNKGLISLRHDGLQATAGLDEDLLDTRYRQDEKKGAINSALPPWRQATPAPFHLTRTWQDAEGLMHSLGARGRLECGPAQPRELPLAELMLEPCALTLAWQDGSTTQGTLWRDPDDYRLWAVEEQAWPDGPEVRWEVARQWW